MLFVPSLVKWVSNRLSSAKLGQCYLPPRLSSSISEFFEKRLDSGISRIKGNYSSPSFLGSRKMSYTFLWSWLYSRNYDSIAGINLLGRYCFFLTNCKVKAFHRFLLAAKNFTAFLGLFPLFIPKSFSGERVSVHLVGYRPVEHFLKFLLSQCLMINAWGTLGFLYYFKFIH